MDSPTGSQATPQNSPDVSVTRTTSVFESSLKATAFEAKNGHVTLYTNEGIRVTVPHEQLKTLIAASLDALTYETGMY